jgi:hypothetical protein
MKKFNIETEFERINSISLEHVRKSDKILHTFLLIFVSASANNASLVEIDKNRKNIISSDYMLIKSNPDNINIRTINSKI